MRPKLIVVTLVAMLAAASGRATELIMFEEDWCAWCERWNAEVGVIYDKTPEGVRAPLRRVDIHGAHPADVELAMRPQFTPTFVLVSEGREVGRIEGYPGEEFFWALLAEMLEKLPKEQSAPATSGVAVASTD